jgi:hypothetical protein
MNIKERIIRSRLARLYPTADPAFIERLCAEMIARSETESPKEQPPESPAAPKPARLSALTDADIDNFRSLDTEALIRSALFGDIWLVPERTGGGRFELLPEEILTLDRARRMFSARIVEVTKNVPI